MISAYLEEDNSIYIEGDGAEIEDVETQEITAHFRRCDNYNGEYGFDWYRDYYDSSIADASKLNDLKKEYTPTKINGQDYYSPWLAIKVDQEAKIKLKFENKRLKEIDELLNAEYEKEHIEGENPNKKEIKNLNKEKDEIEEELYNNLADDIIQLPSSEKIVFEPNELSFDDIKDNWECELTVKCKKSFDEHSKLEVRLKKRDTALGSINIYKNDNVPKLLVKVVKVIGSEKDNSYNERVFGSSLNQDVKFQEIESNIKKLQNELNEKYLNQALIQIEFDDIEELNIDVEKYIQEKWLNHPNGLSIPQFNPDKIGSPLYDNFLESKGIDKFNGIVVFYMAMSAPDLRGGQGNLFPRVPDRIVMPPDQVEATDATSLAHEIGHTLGLHHPFEKLNYFDNSIVKVNQNRKKYIYQYDSYINTIKSMDDKKTFSVDGIKGKSKKEAIEYYENKRKECNDKYDRQVADRLMLRSYHKHIFNEAKTENIMDYTQRQLNRDVLNPYDLISYSKWQWEAMHNEIEYLLKNK